MKTKVFAVHKWETRIEIDSESEHDQNFRRMLRDSMSLEEGIGGGNVSTATEAEEQRRQQAIDRIARIANENIRYEGVAVNPKIGSPQEVEHLPRLKILELMIKAIADEKLPISVLTTYESTIGWKLSEEVKETLYCYYDPEYKPVPKRIGRMIRIE